MQTGICVVSYEIWQMQCCGTPFSVGDRVQWPVYKRPDSDVEEKDESLIGVDFIYEAHGTRLPSDMFSLTGVVTDIRAEYYRTELLPHMRNDNKQNLMPTLVYDKSFEVSKADGRNKDIDDLTCSSYRITLNGCVIEEEFE